MEQENMIVTEELVGVRLDKVLNESFEDYSRSYLQQLIKEGRVLINGQVAKANYKCRLNDQIEINIPEPEVLDVIPEEMDLDIVYQDDYVIVVNKPEKYGRTSRTRKYEWDACQWIDGPSDGFIRY